MMINTPRKRFFLVSVLSIAAFGGFLLHSAPGPAVATAAVPSKHESSPLRGADAPDEMGRIPILMYHSVGDKVGGRSAALVTRLGLNVSSSKFRENLEAMHRAGWYPVNMRDVLSSQIPVPRGKTPVVLTFDDARKSQFYYLKDGTVDPSCALGVLLAMHKKYGDEWPNRAVFYVLPESKFNPAPFGQKPLVDKKLKFLVDQGFEVANHSTSHHAMTHMSARQLEQEMEVCYKCFKTREPRVTMDTMALPYGSAPRNHALWDVLLDGRSVDPSATYHNRCILMAWGDASYAPIDSRFDTKQVMRIGSEPGNIERWIAALKNHKGTLRPYVSDGDPEVVTVPASQTKHLAKAKLDGLKLVVVNDLPPKPIKKPAKAAAKKVAKAVH